MAGARASAGPPPDLDAAADGECGEPAPPAGPAACIPATGYSSPAGVSTGAAMSREFDPPAAPLGASPAGRITRFGHQEPASEASPARGRSGATSLSPTAATPTRGALSLAELVARTGARRRSSGVNSSAYSPTPDASPAPQRPSAPATLTDANEDCCAICFDRLDRNAGGMGLSRLLPCAHEFHTACVDEYFKKCLPRDCPMCRAGIDRVRHGAEGEVTAEALRARYPHACFAIRFRPSDPGAAPGDGGQPYGDDDLASFFAHAEHVRSVLVECTPDRDSGGHVHRYRIPRVVVELLDSAGNIQRGGAGNGIVVSIIHSSMHGTITPDTAMVQDGLAVFEDLLFECKVGPSDTHHRHELLALKFWAQAPEHLVNRKSVYSGLYLKHDETFCLSLYWSREVLCKVLFGLVVLVVCSTIIACLIAQVM